MHPTHHRTFPFLTVLIALASLLLLAGPARADFNGTEVIQLGDSRAAEFDGTDDPAAHKYWFYAPAGTFLSAGVKVGKAGDLQPGLGLFDANGAAVPLGAALVVKKPTAPQIKKFQIAETGWYYLAISPDAGSGDYTLKSKGKFGNKKAQFATDEFTLEVDALGGSFLSASAKASKGSGAMPVFTGLSGPVGAIPITEGTKLKKIMLPLTGTYTLTWKDDASSGGNVDFKLGVKSPKNIVKKRDLGDSYREIMGVVEAGDPDGTVTPTAGYVGSDTCKTCHNDVMDPVFDNVMNSLHNSKMRNTFRSGGAGYVVPPAMDALFRQGADMTALVPAFANLGGLRVAFNPADALPYKIIVGGVTYDVQYVMGGNGYWKQRYVVKVGNSHYISPIQFNEVDGSIVAYHPENWYDTAGDSSALPQLDTTTSWERRCAGCHATGVSVEWDVATSEYRTWYAQQNVGCEACHGPGETHAGTLDADDILNPRDLLNGTAEGVKAADLVCGQCHGRGSGDTPTGAPKATGYPWKEGGSVFPPGNTNIEEYYTWAGSSSYWQYKENPMGDIPTSGNTYLSSKQHHQQYLDLIIGPHAPDQLYDGTCMDCHDAHGNGVKHQITEELSREGHDFTDVENDNNKLCLACHKGHGDFDGLTANDVDGIMGNSMPLVVANAVIDHMADKAAMPIELADFDPTGDGTGRCSKCHMPKMAKSAIWTPDAAGHLQGDVHSHSFLPVWPNISELTDGAVTNSCNGCHPLDPNDEAAEIIEQWAGDPDDDGTYHASTPRNYQTGVANHNRDGGVACSACHTTQGFLEIQVYGNDIHDYTGDTPDDEDKRREFVEGSIVRDKGITCDACHGKQTDGTFAAGPNPLRFPKAELCGKCHNNETVLEEDWAADGEIVRHPQYNMIEGMDGGEVPGYGYGASAHTGLTDGCVTCHYNPAAGGEHTFEPTVAACQVCHTTLTTLNRTARADYDGDASTEGIQDEVNGCLTLLETAILAATPSDPDVTITKGSSYFEIGRGGGMPVDPDRSNSDLLDPVDDEEILRAIFNYYWVAHDGSGGIHNPEYALQLLQQAWKDLTGNSWPGTERAED